MDAEFSLLHLAVLGHGLKLPNGMVIDEVEIQADRLAIVDQKPKFETPATTIVRISPESLQTFIASQLPAMVRDPQVRFQDGKILVSASVKVLVEISATATLSLVIQDQKKLLVELIDVDKPGPVRGILENQLDAVNPVFDAKDLPLDLKLERVAIGENIEIFATATA